MRNAACNPSPLMLTICLFAAPMGGCNSPEPSRITTWRDWGLGTVYYERDSDDLRITLEGGSFSESLRVRRLSTSPGLAVNPFDVWAPKMWAHADLTVHGSSGLTAPGWIAFELYEPNSFQGSEKVWQHVRINIEPPPASTLSIGGKRVTPK